MDLHLIQQRIFELRGHKIMLDFDLAELYQVETKALNQAVKRNKARFPKDFMFRLTLKEWRELLPETFATSGFQMMRSQNVTASQRKRNTTSTPFAFTEHGVTMLASILKSPKAVKMNIAIVRAFVALKEMAIHYGDLSEKIADLEKKYDGQFSDIYRAVNMLIAENDQKKDWESRHLIGFNRE